MSATLPATLPAATRYTTISGKFLVRSYQEILEMARRLGVEGAAKRLADAEEKLRQMQHQKLDLWVGFAIHENHTPGRQMEIDEIVDFRLQDLRLYECRVVEARLCLAVARREMEIFPTPQDQEEMLRWPRSK